MDSEIPNKVPIEIRSDIICTCPVTQISFTVNRSRGFRYRALRARANNFRRPDFFWQRRRLPLRSLGPPGTRKVPRLGTLRLEISTVGKISTAPEPRRAWRGRPAADNGSLSRFPPDTPASPARSPDQGSARTPTHPPPRAAPPPRRYERCARSPAACARPRVQSVQHARRGKAGETSWGGWRGG